MTVNFITPQFFLIFFLFKKLKFFVAVGKQQKEEKNQNNYKHNIPIFCNYLELSLPPWAFKKY